MTSSSTIELDSGGSTHPVGDVGQVPKLAPSEAQRLREIVDDHHVRIWRVLKNLGVHPSNVDDALQQVFIVAAGKLSVIQLGKEGPFLFGVAVRIASRYRRNQKRLREREVAEEELPLDVTYVGGHNANICDAIHARRFFRESLERMPADVRTVFVMYEIEELTLGEIAQALGEPLGTIASRLRRGRELFLAHARRLDAKDQFAEGAP